MMLPQGEASWLSWAVALLYAGSAVAYAAHVWLVYNRIRQSRAASLGWGLGPPARTRVDVSGHVLSHDGELFLLRDVLTVPDEA